MPVAVRTFLISGLAVALLCLTNEAADAARRRAILGSYPRAIPVPAAVSVCVPGGVAVAPAAIPMPIGSLATVRDFPGGVLYGGAYRAAAPAAAPPCPAAMRRVVRYGRSDFVGPRGYSAVVSPWPLVPVTTPSKPFGVGVVPPGEVVAWQSPSGYFYRANYQSPVMRGCPAPGMMQSPGIDAGPAEIVPPGMIETPLEPIPVPAAEVGPQF